MKKIIISSLAVIFSLTIVATAQKQVARKTYSKSITPDMIAEQKTNRLDKQLQLSPEQKTEVYKIYRASAEKRLSVAGHNGKSITEMNTEQNAAIEKVLTPAQKAIIKQQEAERKAEMKKIEAQRSRLNINQSRENLKNDLD